MGKKEEHHVCLDAIGVADFSMKEIRECEYKRKYSRTIKSSLNIALQQNFEMWFAEEYKQGYEQGYAKGYAMGLAEGERQRAFLIAKKLIASGMPVDAVANMTDLSKEELESL